MFHADGYSELVVRMHNFEGDRILSCRSRSVPGTWKRCALSFAAPFTAVVGVGRRVYVVDFTRKSELPVYKCAKEIGQRRIA